MNDFHMSISELNKGLLKSKLERGVGLRQDDFIRNSASRENLVLVAEKHNEEEGDVT